MKAFVAGATGETGRHIVQELVQRDIPVRAFVRNLDRAREILPHQAELLTGDVLDAKSLSEALQDCTTLLCATGARPSFDPTGPYKVDYQGTQNLIQAAQNANIEQFVLVSSLCTSEFFHPLNLFWLVLYWKKQAEEALRKSGLTYTIVRPGGLKNEDTPAPIIMRSADSLSEGNIPRQKVARVCVEALFSPDARNKILEIVTNEDAPERDIAQLFAGVT
ncbi:MAG: SDR family oxidoreductase [Phormidium sp. GEM2.Bin31]|nr:SDR family oxidoreductase [Phormidium sp. BM_Day4_Bin.17]TVR04829.1 MAG: SDR family oxidoreductase [Phormidium sp. GEM2.Bin31]UCJ13420.1 MAG: SDR family oxidoreductase [Phormidium sp. PBR-2020]